MKNEKAPKAGRGRGVLLLIASIFFVSVLTRIFGSSGELLAKEAKALMQEHESQAVDSTHESSQGYSSEQLRTLIEDLEKREKAVEEKEIAIKNRLQALNVAETAFERSRAKLTDAEEKLRATMALANTASEDDLAKLTTMYENMKPKDAAALFEEMDPEFSAGFLGRMRPEAAAGILSGLTPNTAYSLSVILAGRNASIPKE